MALRKSHLGIDFEPIRGFIDGDPNDTRLPVDLDLLMERRGKFFMGECKQPGEQVSRGQEIMLENLAKQEANIVYIIELSGAKATNGANLFEPRKYKRVGRDKSYINTTTEEFKGIMKEWWDKSSENKRLQSKSSTATERS